MTTKTKIRKPAVVSRYMMNVPGLAVNIRKGELHGSDLLIEGGELIEAYAAKHKISDLDHAAAILALTCMCVERPVGLARGWYTGDGVLNWMLGNAAMVLHHNAKVPDRVAEETLSVLEQMDSGIYVSRGAQLVNDVLMAYTATTGFGRLVDMEVREVKSLCPYVGEKGLKLLYAIRAIDHAFKYLKDESFDGGKQHWYTGVANMRPKGSRSSYRELYKMECKGVLDNMEETLVKTGGCNDDCEEDETDQD